MKLDADVEKLVTQQIAASVIASLTPESRDEVMRRAVTEALTGYSYKSAVEKAVCVEAAKIAEEMLSRADWQKYIRETVTARLNGVVDTVCESLPEAMLLLFGGKDGPNTYDRGPGLLQAILAKKLKGGEP